MSGYTGRVAANLLPRSMAQTLPAAIKEWHVTGEAADHGHPAEVCQLCEQEGLRYEFGIANQGTGYRMMVGSRCILKFRIAMADGSRSSARNLAQLVKAASIKACLGALIAVCQAERSDVLDGALRYFRQHECLTPRAAWVVLWRLRQLGIKHDARQFRIALRRKSQLRELAAMPRERVGLLWPALTKAQRDRVETHWRFYGMQGLLPPIVPPAVPPRPVMIGEGARFTYEQWKGAGWTDVQLVAHGYMRWA
jgi:hypothetical protein